MSHGSVGRGGIAQRLIGGRVARWARDRAGTRDEEKRHRKQKEGRLHRLIIAHTPDPWYSTEDTEGQGGLSEQVVGYAAGELAFDGQGHAFVAGSGVMRCAVAAHECQPWSVGASVDRIVIDVKRNLLGAWAPANAVRCNASGTGCTVFANNVYARIGRTTLDDVTGIAVTGLYNPYNYTFLRSFLASTDRVAEAVTAQLLLG